MPDLEDDGFTEEAFSALEAEADATPPKNDNNGAPADDPTKTGADDKPADDSKKKEGEDANPDNAAGGKPEGAAKPDKEEHAPDPSDKPADPAKKPDGTAAPTAPETPKAEEPAAPQPLTKDDVKEVVTNLLTSERTSSREVEIASQEVLEAYYPDGLSNVLVDERTGKELRTPQDVVDASNGEMTTEQAAQWLMNEQYKLDQEVAKIKGQAREIAETTINFKRDATMALEKYAPLFEAYPHLQKKVFDRLMKQVKVDEKRNVILSAPDVMEHYDFYLEPYQKAFEFATNKPATNPTPDPNPQPKPTAEDRMDENGDGGTSPVDDPNDFAQQVTKELAKGI